MRIILVYRGCTEEAFGGVMTMMVSDSAEGNILHSLASAGVSSYYILAFVKVMHYF